jgi:hypothetical protein
MTRACILAATLALAAPAAAAPAAVAPADPTFALVGATTSADGSQEWPCLTGARASGVKVVLFGADARACRGTTREVTEGIAGGTCTRVDLEGACATRGLSLAVLGAERLPDLRVFPRAPVTDPRRLAALSAAVERSGLRQAVAARGKRWRCPEPVEVAASPAEAYGFAALPDGPVIVRYPVTEGPARDRHPGTALVVQGDAVSAPFDVHALDPVVFGFSGRVFLWGGSFAGGSGLRLDQIFAVERGSLRLLYESGDLST